MSALAPAAGGAVAVLRVGVLFLAGLGAAAQFAKFSVLFPAWQAAYPHAGAWLGFLVTLVSLTGLAFGLVAGMLVARIGFRRVLIWALLLGAAISTGQALLLPLPAMMALRAAEGLSHLALVVAAPTLMAQISDDRMRPLAMTLWGTFFGTAFAAYALVGPGLLELGGLAAVQVSHAGWMLAVALLVAWALPADPAPARLPPGRVARPETPMTPGRILRRHGQAYGSPRLNAAALGWLFYTLTFVSVMTVLPPTFPEPAREGLSTIIPLAGIITSLTLGALLLRRVAAVRVTLAGFAVSGALALLLGASGGAGWAALALFAALGLVQSGSFALIPQINESASDRALANGAMAQMGNLGNLVGTPILLAATGVLDLAGMVLFLVLAYGGGLLVHLLAARARARQAGPLAAPG
ncbi:MFS transporter [Pseudooceanicola aestuarii]|uniref:MFS transporter n=1 Tax=Pseudooceanicola aestuarii TaxID=2697319 RepID=UPI0013D15728|nr:MFS transporter [Pseudooceanicola aestuarii]